MTAENLLICGGPLRVATHYCVLRAGCVGGGALGAYTLSMGMGLGVMRPCLMLDYLVLFGVGKVISVACCYTNFSSRGLLGVMLLVCFLVALHRPVV